MSSGAQAEKCADYDVATKHTNYEALAHCCLTPVSITAALLQRKSQGDVRKRSLLNRLRQTRSI
jgi:hypothetical protein